MSIKRVITAIAVSCLVALAILNYWASGLVITGLIAAGLYEFFQMVEKKGIKIYRYFGMTVGVAIPLSILFGFELTRNWELLFVVAALTALIILQFARRENLGAIIDISTTVFGILYVSWFFSFLIKIRDLSQGMALLGALIIITKMGDIGACVVGSFFGKTPLLPRISPKKTYEGSLGGLLFSIIGALICSNFIGFSGLHLFFIGLFLGVIGQLGDLSESLFKRDCQVKDSGRLFPGLGGVLDIIDSLLFTAPVFYLYMVTIIRR